LVPMSVWIGTMIVFLVVEGLRGGMVTGESPISQLRLLGVRCWWQVARQTRCASK
jgi:hypothetical protein